MPEVKRYRNGKMQHQKVFVITDDTALTVKYRLIRYAGFFDEHQEQYNSEIEYRRRLFEIFNTLRDKGFVYYDE